MENLVINPTPKTPLINLKAEEGHLLIEGRSIPENSVDFFEPVYAWIDDYSVNPQKVTIMDVKLEYFNTSSSKCILKVLKKLENLQIEKHSEVTINWFFEEDDEDMLEAGQDFDIIISIPFKMIPVKEFEKRI